MSARKKLNGMYLGAAGVLSAFVGLAFASWSAGGIAFALFLVMNMLAGNIRLGGSYR